MPFKRTPLKHLRQRQDTETSRARGRSSGIERVPFSLKLQSDWNLMNRELSLLPNTRRRPASVTTTRCWYFTRPSPSKISGWYLLPAAQVPFLSRCQPKRVAPSTRHLPLATWPEARPPSTWPAHLLLPSSPLQPSGLFQSSKLFDLPACCRPLIKWNGRVAFPSTVTSAPPPASGRCPSTTDLTAPLPTGLSL